MRRFDARWQGENYEANVKAIGQLNEFAMTKGITVTHLALAWLLGQGEDIVAIPGTRNENRLAENVAATDGVLSGTELERIRQMLPYGAFGSTGHMPQWSMEK